MQFFSVGHSSDTFECMYNPFLLFSWPDSVIQASTAIASEIPVLFEDGGSEKK